MHIYNIKLHDQFSAYSDVPQYTTPECVIGDTGCSQYTHVGYTQHFESQGSRSHNAKEYTENHNVGIVWPHRWLKL